MEPMPLRTAVRLPMIVLAAFSLLAVPAPMILAEIPFPPVPDVPPPVPQAPEQRTEPDRQMTSAPRTEPAELRTDSAVRELRSLENRLMLDAGNFRFLLTDIRTPESVYTVAGFGHPLLSAGPVRREGLLGRLYRPLRARAFSSVWDEESGLTLETGISRAPVGGTLNVLPGTLSFIGLLPEDAPAAGISLSLGRPRSSGSATSRFRDARQSASIVLTGLHAIPVAESPQAAVQESWFRDDAPFPGGSLTTGAGEIAVSWRRLSLAAAGAVSRGDRILPGRLLEGRVLVEGGAIRAGAAGALADPQFRSPDGSVSSRLAHAGGEFVLFPNGPLSLEAGAWRTFRRGEVRENYTGARELDLNVSASAGGGPVRVILDGRRKLIEEPRKEPEREGKASLGCVLSGSEAEADLRFSLFESDGTFDGWEATAGGGLSGPRVSAELDTGVERRKDRFRLSVAGTLRRRGGKEAGPDLFLRIENRRPIDLFEPDEDGSGSSGRGTHSLGMLTISAGIGTRTVIPLGER